MYCGTKWPRSLLWKTRPPRTSSACTASRTNSTRSTPSACGSNGGILAAYNNGGRSLSGTGYMDTGSDSFDRDPFSDPISGYEVKW